MELTSKTYEVDADHYIGRWSNVIISIWRRDPSAERLRSLRTWAGRFLSETDGPVFAIVVVEDRCPVPNDMGRKHSVGFIRDLGDRALGIVLVFEGSGFLAATSRAVMLGLMTAASFAMPYDIARTVDEAEAFLIKNSPAVKRGSLIQAVELARRKLPAKEKRLER